MNTNVLTQVQDTSIAMWRKILFSLSGFGRMMGSTLISVYAVYYYTDILGISGVTVGLIILISKIWDIINDPMMGAIVDRTRSKAGKCRFWLKFFSVPGGIVLAMLFMVPEISASGQIAWFAVTYIGQAMFHTVLCIPLNALLGRITSNQKERGTINQITLLFSLAGTYAVTGLAMTIVTQFGGDDIKKGFFGLAIIAGIIYAVTFLAAAIASKGLEPLEFLAENEDGNGEDMPVVETPKLKDSLAGLLQNKYWLLCVGIVFTQVLAEGMSQASMVQHFQYNMQDMSMLQAYSTIGVVTGIASVAGINIFRKFFGNCGTALVGAVLAGAGTLFRFVFADASAMIFIVGTAVFAFGSGLVSSVTVLCLLDSRVYGIWKTGVDNDAILMSGHTTASKVGFAIGPSIGAVLLDVVNYIPQAEVQSESAKTLFLLENTLFIAIGYGLVIIFAFFASRMEKKLPMYQAEVEARSAQERKA